MNKKKSILRLYKHQLKVYDKPKLGKIAEKCNCDRSYVSRVLKEKKAEDLAKKTEEIKEMFYIKHMPIKHISSLENLSEKKVREILKEDEKFSAEKEKRKIENAKRAKANRRKSNLQKDDIILTLLLHQQKTNIAEMSTARKISNTQLYANNIQQYHVHQTKSGSFYAKLDDNIKSIAAADIPKSISLNISFPECKTYTE